MFYGCRGSRWTACWVFDEILVPLFQHYLRDKGAEHRQCLELVEMMLDYLPNERITLKEAMKHQFFRPIHKQYPGRYPSIDEFRSASAEKVPENEDEKDGICRSKSRSKEQEKMELDSIPEKSEKVTTDLKIPDVIVERPEKTLFEMFPGAKKIFAKKTPNEAPSETEVKVPEEKADSEQALKVLEEQDSVASSETDSDRVSKASDKDTLAVDDNEETGTETKPERKRRSRKPSPETPMLDVEGSEIVQEARKARRARRAEREAKLAAEMAEQMDAVEARRARRARRGGMADQVSEESTESDHSAVRQGRRLKRTEAVNDDTYDPEKPDDKPDLISEKASKNIDNEESLKLPTEDSSNADEDLYTRLARKALKAELEKSIPEGAVRKDSLPSSKPPTGTELNKEDSPSTRRRARLKEIEREVAEEEAREEAERRARRNSRQDGPDPTKPKPEPSMRSIFDFFKKSTPDTVLKIYPDLSSQAKKSASPLVDQGEINTLDNSASETCDNRPSSLVDVVAPSETALLQEGDSSIPSKEECATDIPSQETSVADIMVTPPTPNVEQKTLILADPGNNKEEQDLQESGEQNEISADAKSDVPSEENEEVENSQSKANENDVDMMEDVKKSEEMVSESLEAETESVLKEVNDQSSGEVPEAQSAGKEAENVPDESDEFKSASESISPDVTSPRNEKPKAPLKPCDYSMIVEPGPCQIYLEPEPPESMDQAAATGEHSPGAAKGDKKKRRRRPKKKKSSDKMVTGGNSGGGDGEEETCCFLGKPGLDSPLNPPTEPSSGKGSDQTVECFSQIPPSDNMCPGKDSSLGRDSGCLDPTNNSSAEASSDQSQGDNKFVIRGVNSLCVPMQSQLDVGGDKRNR